MKLGDVLRKVGQHLDSEGHHYALVGGLGLAALGIPRATLDLDLIVPAAAQDSLVAYMEGLGYETLHRSEGYSNHLHADPTLGRVDFIYVRGETERRVFASASFLEGPDGVQVLVPKAEHLAAMKVLAMKTDPARRHQELADIARLLALPGVDATEIRGYFEHHGLLESWREIANGEHPG